VTPKPKDNMKIEINKLNDRQHQMTVTAIPGAIDALRAYAIQVGTILGDDPKVTITGCIIAEIEEQALAERENYEGKI
jgi:hypothetical protein